jgi:hypothetical protein
MVITTTIARALDHEEHGAAPLLTKETWQWTNNPCPFQR